MKQGLLGDEARPFDSFPGNRSGGHDREHGLRCDQRLLVRELPELAPSNLLELWPGGLPLPHPGLGRRGRLAHPVDDRTRGGRGLTAGHERAYLETEARFETPSVIPFGITYGMIAPTILAHGSEDAKERYLRALYRGDMVACQLFSEPGAGSDLAGIGTRAELDGDEWVVSGQKVWTSGAHYSDIGEILTRTSPDKPKHKGLTMFIVDMNAPGVDVRPLRQMTGGAAFNEVYFDEVRIPEWHRLGEVDDGWRVALTTLMNERAAIGSSVGAGMGGALMTRLVGLVRHLGIGNDPVVRQRLADIVINGRIAGYTTERATAKLVAGQLPGPEMSIGKLQLTENLRRMSSLLTEVLGPRLVADTGEWGTYSWSEFVLSTPGMRVAGGTDEVMRNIVGERVLGLPKEPSPN
ncbi:MAG: acyl-CoA dehydrogenase [Acidobacteria bacterium ACB2]|nr:acyl-CoA dehydrogenase [Acidobacteria bacterium ACB2]